MIDPTVSKPILQSVLDQCEQGSEVIIFILEPSDPHRPSCVTNVPEHHLKRTLRSIYKCVVVEDLVEVRKGDERAFRYEEE